MKLKIGWSSHLPVLIKLMPLTDYPILELGTGLYSTPYLHWAAYLKKQEIYSYENVEKYFDYANQFSGGLHKVKFVKNWDDELFARHWGIVLIDHAPGERRIIDIRRLAHCSEFIVIHDSEPENDKEYGYEQIYPLFRFRYDFKEIKPYTTVLSNINDLTDFRV